jgi:outer membrane lipoprotein-sorting protein
MAVRHNRIGPWVCACLIVGSCSGLHAAEATQEGKEGTDKGVFQDEPQARALYDKMIEALRQTQTMSYKGDHRWSSGQESEHCSYTVRLKKPNCFRVEAVSEDGKKRGTIIGDGGSLWLFWSGDRPRFREEREEESYLRTRSKVYMKEATPLGAHHSIGHKTPYLGVGMAMPVIDPSSAFDGFKDPLRPYLDGVMGIGMEKIADEECDGIEVSFMKHQRSWYLWLSRKDHLPRKLRSVLRWSQDIVVEESWSEVRMNSEIPQGKFVWTPPEGWQQWEMPTLEDALLKPGTQAPDFELTSLDGGKIKLSDFQDKVVWLYLWRAG